MGRVSKQKMGWRERQQKLRDERKAAGYKPLSFWLHEDVHESLKRLREHYKEKNSGVIVAKAIKELEERVLTPQSEEGRISDGNP